jgi:hypothetical protein
MFHELSIPVTMKAMAPGHPFTGVEELLCSSSPLPGQMACQSARRIADAIMLHVVLLCTLLGYRMVRTDEAGLPEERAFFRACRFSSRDICGIFPVFTGTGAGSFRIFLHQ